MIALMTMDEYAASAVAASKVKTLIMLPGVTMAVPKTGCMIVLVVVSLLASTGVGHVRTSFLLVVSHSGSSMLTWALISSS